METLIKFIDPELNTNMTANLNWQSLKIKLKFK
jgi:hypothetical protein